MKKFVKIYFRNKEHNITLPFEVVEQIMDDEKQITKLTKDGVWTGEIINKSEIVATRRDVEEERDQNRENNRSRLIEQGEQTAPVESLNKLKEKMDEIKNKLTINN